MRRNCFGNLLDGNVGIIVIAIYTMHYLEYKYFWLMESDIKVLLCISAEIF